MNRLELMFRKTYYKNIKTFAKHIDKHSKVCYD